MEILRSLKLEKDSLTIPVSSIAQWRWSGGPKVPVQISRNEFFLGSLQCQTNMNQFLQFEPVLTTDLNYWIKHPFEFSDPILKPEYL